MELSIIIINWNTKNLLLRCLTSIDQKVKGIQKEVFVIDNGSADGSPAAVRKRFPEVVLIQNPINHGFVTANNQALNRSKERYVLLLNPDTEVKAGAIQTLFSFMESRSEAGVAGAQLLNGDGTRQNSIANFPCLATELLNKSLLRWIFPKTFPGKEIAYSEPIEVESVIGACMMVRRDVTERPGLLDEDYFLFLEETDWCYRIRRAGWKIYHVPEAEVYHFQGKSAEKEKKKAKVEYYRSRYIFFRKNRGSLPSFILRVGLIFRLILELMALTVACFFTFFAMTGLRNRLSTYAYVTRWHLRGCPEGMGLRSDK